MSAATKVPKNVAKRLTWNFDGETQLLQYKNVHTVCESHAARIAMNVHRWASPPF
jgi:hypothetical protein